MTLEVLSVYSLCPGGILLHFGWETLLQMLTFMMQLFSLV